MRRAAELVVLSATEEAVGERMDMTAADHAPGQTIDMQPSQPGVTTVVEIPELVTEASGEADAVLEEDV